VHGRRDGRRCGVACGGKSRGGLLRGRWLGALRHEAPPVQQTAERLGVEGDAATLQVLKTIHTTHGGKISLARLLSGTLKDGETLFGRNGSGERVSGLFTLTGQEPTKISDAVAGATVALGRMDDVVTGETLSSAKGETTQRLSVQPPSPVYGRALSAAEKKDEVKLTTALSKIIEEDPSIALEHDADTHDMVLWGQGEMHLRVALERLSLIHI